MPRTKRSVAKKKKPVEDIEALKKWDRFLTEVKNQIDLLTQKKCRDIELEFKMLAELLGPDLLQRTVGDLKGELALKEQVTNTRPTRPTCDCIVSTTTMQLQDEVTEIKNQNVLLTHRKCRDIELAFKMLAASLGPDLLQRTVGDLKGELALKEQVTNTRPTRPTCDCIVSTTTMQSQDEVTEIKNQIDLLTQKKYRDIELAFKMLAESLGPDLLQRTVGDLKGELALKEQVTNTRPTRPTCDCIVSTTTMQLQDEVTEIKNQIDLLTQKKCRDIELAFKMLAESLGPDLLQRTVGDLKGELALKEQVTNTRPTRPTCDCIVSTTTMQLQDEGYLTEGSSHGSGGRRTTGKKTMGGPPTTAGRATGRPSRSTDARRGMQTVTKTASRMRSKSDYKTPAYNRSAGANFPPITPKVAPNTPLTVLRHPRQGEIVVSMSGSQVMVPTYNNMQQSERANCNIMLEDGTMLSLQSMELRQSSAYMSFSLDESLLAQLEDIEELLEGGRAHEEH